MCHRLASVVDGSMLDDGDTLEALGAALGVEAVAPGGGDDDRKVR